MCSSSFRAQIRATIRNLKLVSWRLKKLVPVLAAKPPGVQHVHL
jgi:hypothetical protein